MHNCSNMSNKGDQWPQMVFSKPICVEVARLSWLGQLVQSVIAEPHVPISVLTRLDVQQLWQCPNLWCVRLSRLLVGFRTHFKWLHFDFQFWCTDVTFILLFIICIHQVSFNMLAVTYDTCHTHSVLFRHDWYLTQLWTMVAQHPLKL